MMDKAAPLASREASMLTFELLCSSLVPSFEPYMVHLLPSFLTNYSDLQVAVRDAAEAAAHAVAAQLAPQGVKLVMAPILQAMSDRRARVPVRCAPCAHPLRAPQSLEEEGE
jgi:hypothetical protein